MAEYPDFVKKCGYGSVTGKGTMAPNPRTAGAAVFEAGGGGPRATVKRDY